MAPLLQELSNELMHAGIDARFDLPTRVLYSTDASIYQIEPLGVVFPKTQTELANIVDIACRNHTPVLARGAGSSLAGQAIGRALILDCSRYLNRIIEVDPEEQAAIIEPGCVLNSLNKAAAQYKLQFGPDPASGERATLGGSIANNATGARSIVYGMAADHILSAHVVFANGSEAVLEEIPLDQARHISGQNDIRGSLYLAALEIRDGHADHIMARWSRTWRRAAGYNLNYLLPWSPGAPPAWKLQFDPTQQTVRPYPPIAEGTINLAPLLAGSEGTLAVFRQMKVRLVPVPKHSVLGVIAFGSIAEACDAAPEILNLGPTAIELIPGSLINLARSVPAYASQLSFVDEIDGGEARRNLLVVEFSGEEFDPLQKKIDCLQRCLKPESSFLAALNSEQQKMIWSVRKVGLGLLSSRPGDLKSVTFIEDLSVPVETLGKFVRELQEIFKSHGVEADYYAHASAGCLHIRPMLNLKTEKGKTDLRSIAHEAIQLTLKYGGAASGEHGVGLARSEWLADIYGDEIVNLFRALKNAADPEGLLNPGKIIDAPRMDENLRYEVDGPNQTWPTTMSFSRQNGLLGAIEMCNGAGVCRKNDGIMCPSFQASQDEALSTRGRANLLRTLVSKPIDSQSIPEITEATFRTLDLCLACKGCKAECPSAVDMASLKYEFTHHFYQTHRRKLRDYLFAYIGPLLKLGNLISRLVNAILRSEFAKKFGDKRLGISARRHLPVLSKKSLHQSLGGVTSQPGSGPIVPICFLLSDPFTEYLQPEVGLAAIQVLESIGYRVTTLPVIGAGRTLLSKGFVPQAREQASRLIRRLQELDPEGQIPVIGLEPSEILTLRDEFLEFFPTDDYVQRLAGRAWMIDEFLVRPDDTGHLRIKNLISDDNSPSEAVLIHGHCYQKAQPLHADGHPSGAGATQKMLEMCGYSTRILDTGCCGMAGAFGYETEHYEFSMKVGELTLFPALREAGDVLVAAAGVSCQAQIKDGVGVDTYHPIQLVQKEVASRRIRATPVLE